MMESGMALFTIQLARVMVSASRPNGELDSKQTSLGIIASIHEVLNVIILSVIVTLYLTDNVDLVRA